MAKDELIGLLLEAIEDSKDTIIRLKEREIVLLTKCLEMEKTIYGLTKELAEEKFKTGD